MKKIIMLICGHLFLMIGIIGIFVPVLPTTPFLLLSAFFYSESSPKIHNWMMNHKVLGPPLKDWQDNGVIGIKAKIISAAMIGFVLFLRIPKLDINLYVKVIVSAILFSVLLFVLTRPSKRE